MQTSSRGTDISRYFSGTYAEARAKFVTAASRCGAELSSYILDECVGLLGEELAIDVALVGPPNSERMLVVSSGTHGPEGFCGSGAQIAALHDDELINRLAPAKTSLLLIHAINPYGFSYLQRTNENNVDLNRNHIDFSVPLPINTDYAEIVSFVSPGTWPPAEEYAAAEAAYVERHGAKRFHAVLTRGQHIAPEGLYFGGISPAWSNTAVRSILRRYAANARRLGWIDIHTGLGPYGHGEKLFPGRNIPADVALALAWWGADVFPMYAGAAVSGMVAGSVVSAAYDECPDARLALLGLEFGTVPIDEMLWRLRAATWLRNHPEATALLKSQILEQLRDAFYCDNGEWKGMVLGQVRVAILQAIQGLGSFPVRAANV